jgi:hypothetical protein
MSYFSNKDNTVKSMTVLFMFAFVLLCNVSVFGQEIKKQMVISSTTEIVSDAKEESTSSSKNRTLIVQFQQKEQIQRKK